MTIVYYLLEYTSKNYYQNQKSKDQINSTISSLSSAGTSAQLPPLTAAIGLLTEYFADFRLRDPWDMVLLADADRLNVISYVNFSFIFENLQVYSATVTLTTAGGMISGVYTELASPTLVVVLLYLTNCWSID